MNEKQMKDMAVSILLDEYTQLDVAQLLKEYEEAEENGELPDVSDSLDEKCTEMIRREFKKKKHKKLSVQITKVLYRVAAVALMLVGLCTVSILSVEAWRVPALQFVWETFDRRSSVSMEGEGSQENRSPETIIEKLAHSLPEDYVLVQKNLQDGHYQVRYMDHNGAYAELVIATYRHSSYFDTEHAEGTKIQISGREAIVISKNGLRILWLEQDSQLFVDFRANNLSEKSFWNIAKAMMD